MELSEVLFALSLTLLAGLATSIGGLVGVLGPRENHRGLARSLGFAAGVMLWVSFVEMLPRAVELGRDARGPGVGDATTTVAFFVGVGLVALVAAARPPTASSPTRSSSAVGEASRLRRLGLLTAFILALHNLPEGFATFMSALAEPRLAIPIAVAIAIHNIPEGIAVAVPIYRASGSRARGFWVASLSGLAEPVGAVLAWLVLRPFLDAAVMAAVLAGLSGIMVHLSLTELLPTAREFHPEGPSVSGGLVAGMGVMAVSLLLLG